MRKLKESDRIYGDHGQYTKRGIRVLDKVSPVIAGFFKNEKDLLGLEMLLLKTVSFQGTMARLGFGAKQELKNERAKSRKQHKVAKKA